MRREVEKPVLRSIRMRREDMGSMTKKETSASIKCQASHRGLLEHGRDLEEAIDGFQKCPISVLLHRAGVCPPEPRLDRREEVPWGS